MIKSVWLLTSGIFISFKQITLTITHTGSLIFLPALCRSSYRRFLFQMWKNATFVIVHLSLLVQVDVLLQQVENVATYFFSFFTERVKVKLLLCWYSSALFEYINCRYCVFIAYKDYQYYSPHIFLKVNFRATMMTLVWLSSQNPFYRVFVVRRLSKFLYRTIDNNISTLKTFLSFSNVLRTFDDFTFWCIF